MIFVAFWVYAFLGVFLTLASFRKNREYIENATINSSELQKIFTILIVIFISPITALMTSTMNIINRMKK